MRGLVKLFIISLLLLSVKTEAQVDPHFSQYYAYPLFLNPGLTGVAQGDYRATAIYRNQWSSIGRPFVTKGISADMSTSKNLNLGINILDQKAGGGGYQLTNGYLSVAYSGLQLDADGNKRFVFGLSAGMINRKIEPSKFEFGDQWMPIIGYNPALNTSEVFNRRTSSDFDAGAGIVYYDSDPDKNVNVVAGFSANHLTRPDDPFLFGEKQQLPIRYTLHGGLRFTLSENSSLVTNGIFMRQGNAEEKMIGAYLQMIASETVDVFAGLNYRYKDAVVPMIGLGINRLQIGLSYDVTTSDLSKGAGKPNSFEISLTLNSAKSDRSNYFRCPVF